MKIKEVMQRTGLSEKTIRYYESCGLIHTITSRSNGRTYHEFDENSIVELQNILMLRKAEFSIEEILKMQQDPTCISAIVTAYQQCFVEKKKITDKLIADDELKNADDWKDLSFRIHRALTRIEGYESPMRFGQFDPESEAEKQSAIDAYYERRKGRLSKRTERWFRGIFAVLLVLLVVLVLVPVCFTMKGEADAVCDSLIGAENVMLGLGAYASEDGDAWTPEQVLYEEDAALTLKSGSESQQEKILEAAEIAEQEYDSFTAALNAASEINVQEICPLSARSSYR